MQIKKDEVKQRLLDAASTEFILKGFEKSSIRTIVKKANTTIGNFYNYFDSKETIFGELVSQAYMKFGYLINNHQEQEYENKLIKSTSMDVWRDEISKLFSPLFLESDESIILLFECSDGTKYVHAKEDVVKFLSDHLNEHIDHTRPDYQYRQMGPLIARQLIDAIVEILRTTEDETLKEQLIVEQVLYCGLGIMGILKGEIND